MIRTVMTLRMSSGDLQDTTFLINDTQVGYLSQSVRKNQVFSSHRYIQIVAGFRTDHILPDAAERQRETLRLWQRCSRDVQQKGLSVLSQAAGHYNLSPEWLIGIDNRFMHAWLTESFTVCLLRESELFQVDPVADQHSKMPDSWRGILHQSTVELMEGDYFLFLPPSFFDFVSAEETQQILNGMQQLSVKINELVELGRIRGYEIEKSWIALQVQRIEFDTVQGLSFKEKLSGLISKFSRPDAAETARKKAENSSLRQKASQYGEEQGLNGNIYPEDVGIEIKTDNSQLSETEMAAAAARASMTYGHPNPLAERKYADRPMHANRSKNNNVAVEARNRSSRGQGILAVWAGWKREQKWLAVLLAISVVILIAWGISTAVNRNNNDLTPNSSTTDAALPTPTPIPPSETTTTAPPEVFMEVAVRSLNFREAPGTDAGLITTLNEGTVVTKLSDPDEGWMKVKLEDGREAFAFAEYLREVENLEDSEETS